MSVSQDLCLTEGCETKTLNRSGLCKKCRTKSCQKCDKKILKHNGTNLCYDCGSNRKKRQRNQGDTDIYSVNL